MSSAKEAPHYEAQEKIDTSLPLSASTRLLNSDTTPWYQKPNLRRLYLFLVPAAIGVEMTSGFDGSVLNGLQAVDKWNECQLLSSPNNEYWCCMTVSTNISNVDFDHPDGAMLGLISSMMNVGSVASIPLVPYFNDRWGRRFCIIIGSLIVVGGVIIQTAAVNQAMLIVSRFFLGFGLPFAIAGASQLLSELCYPKERAVISGLFHESWYAGAILAAGTTLGTFDMTSDWSWRLPTLFQMVPSVLQLAFIWFIPESPRFLIAKDRHEEARAILITYHAEGDENSPLVLAEYQEICEAIRAEKEASTQPWKELFSERNNVRRVLIAIGVGLFAQWSGNGLVSYYLAKVLETIGITSRLRQNQINLGLMCWNLATGVAGSFVQHWVKRRTQWLTSFAGMTVVYGCWTASSAVYADDDSNEHASRAVVALIFIYYGMYNLMMPLAYVYITECFSYLQRSKGMAIMLIFSRFGSAFNAFVNPIGLKAIEWRMYIVYTCWLAIETTYIFLFYPETFGMSLEEASEAVTGRAYRSKKVEDKLDGADHA